MMVFFFFFPFFFEIQKGDKDWHFRSSVLLSVSIFLIPYPPINHPTLSIRQNGIAIKAWQISSQVSNIDVDLKVLPSLSLIQSLFLASRVVCLNNFSHCSPMHFQEFQKLTCRSSIKLTKKKKRFNRVQVTLTQCLIRNRIWPEVRHRDRLQRQNTGTRKKRRKGCCSTG